MAALKLDLMTMDGRALLENVACVADSGATVNLFPSQLFSEEFLSTLVACKSKIHCANDAILQLSGEAHLQAKRHGVRGPTVKLRAIFSPQVTQPLISKSLLIDLKILPPGFPNCTYDQAAAATEKPASRCKGGEQKSLFETERTKALLKKYEKVFDVSTISKMKYPPIKLELIDGAPIYPLNVSVSRKYPVHIEEPAKLELDRLVRLGILEPVREYSPWCSAAFFIPKGKTGEVRLITDFSVLSKYIKRPVHPFPCVQDILRSIKSGMTHFCSLDAKQGYFQLQLDPESRYLTTFITPWGRYRYKVAPMGLSISGDHFCLASDLVLEGMENVFKIVDDILICAASLDELYAKIDEVLRRCAEANMKINDKKIQIGTEVNFAGFLVTSKGSRPLPSKLEALSKFPVPTNVTGVRSFLGACQQLAVSAPDLSYATAKLRELIRQDVIFQWTPVHQDAFETCKKILMSPKTIAFYDPKLPTTIYCDGSKLFGLGYLLTQKGPDNVIKLIQCGSRSLTSCESRYSATELELLALTYAIRDSSFYLLHAPRFMVETDHKALLGLFAKSLHDIENSRLVRLREKVLHYDFDIKWVKGKDHLMADALSRNPVFQPTHEEVEEAEQLHYAFRLVEALPDPINKQLYATARTDKGYQLLITALRQNSKSALKTNPFTHYFIGFFEELSLSKDERIVLWGERIVLPTSLIKPVLKTLHLGHPGQERMYKAAKQLYVWAGLRNDVEQVVLNCSACLKMLPSNEKDFNLSLDKACEPMEIVGADLFNANGKEYLLLVDDYSGYFFIFLLRGLNTKAILKHLDKTFSQFGYPRMLLSDNGPQFRTEFRQYCEAKSIYHRTSTPYYSQSNGLSEAGVKRAKYLLLKSDEKSLDDHLLGYFNTPRSNSNSTPAMLFFGRPLRMPNRPEKRFLDGKGPSQIPDNEKLRLLSRGERVLIQNPKTRRWDRTGSILEPNTRSHRSYDVLLEDGMTIRCNRSQLRPLE